jgi:group I intron endonuclease
MSGRTHSDESKNKISDSHKKIDHSGRFTTGHKHLEETKQKISDAQKGHKHLEETKNKISDAQKGENHPNYGQTFSDKTKQKMSDAKKGQPRVEGSGKPSQAIEVIDSKNNTTTSYDSIKEAARVLNISHSVIVKYFSRNQQKPYKGRYTFKKVN